MIVDVKQEKKRGLHYKVSIIFLVTRSQSWVGGICSNTTLVVLVP